MNRESSSEVETLRVTPVILCGGSGTRLWPLSRSGFPKQFLSLTGKESLFQQTVNRLQTLTDSSFKLSSPLVVCNEAHRFLVMEQLRESGLESITTLLEPEGRNTAPALTLAALEACSMVNDDPVLIVTPADQTITDKPAFHSALKLAIEHASKGELVVLGILPDKAETGFGYIQAEPSNAVSGVFNVKRFVEKPNLQSAQQYITQGGYYWNAGIFILRASVWLQALKAFQPEMADAVQLAWNCRHADGAFIRPDVTAFQAVPSDSVDYAVLERCPGSSQAITMVPLEAGWSDLGTWDAVWNFLPKDASGNATQGDVLILDSYNNLVQANHRLVSLIGVNDLVVVETADALLISNRAHSQGVKHIVRQLSEKGRDEHALHRKVHRPWGWYDCIDEGGRFKVKRIQVNPKASLSLQLHHHRAEHWIVVKGTAEITNGQTKVLLTENQSTYIPLGETHRLANPGTIPLEIIEVQSGSYLGEDDIVRFEDTYGRE
jgi:mannose-1-phosphate guanylyltransferase/mannose-6-phosphate isomerase